MTELEKIAEGLRTHQLADESFQNAQQIHNLEMKKAQEEMTETMQRMEKKLDPIVEMFSNLKWSQKILLRVGAFIGALIAGTLGILEILKILKH